MVWLEIADPDGSIPGMVNGKQVLKRRNPVRDCQQDASIMFQVKFLKQSLQELSV